MLWPLYRGSAVDVVLLATGVVAIFVAAFLIHLQQWSVTPPFLGLVTGILIGPEVLGVLEVPATEQHHLMTVSSRLLLAVALMAIALRYPISHMRRRVRDVALLLAVVLPVMAGVVAAGAATMLGLSVGTALVLGAALAPTDPVLASGIATGPLAERSFPERLRQILSLESGANDGLAMPLVVIALATALDHSMAVEVGRAVYEVVGGVAIGAITGWVAGHAMRWARRQRDEMASTVRELYTLVLAVLVLGLGRTLNASGLLSVFVAGLVHNHLVTGSDRKVELGIDETLNHFLVIPVFILFGAVLPWTDWGSLGWSGLGFVAVALFLRRLPVVLLLRRPLRFDWTDGIWLGWFGPIGVAAVFYLGHAHDQGLVDPQVWAAGTLVVATSTVAHGWTAGPARVAFDEA